MHIKYVVLAFAIYQLSLVLLVVIKADANGGKASITYY